MSRKNAREDAFRLIFEGMANTDSLDERIERYLEIISAPSEDESAFINTPSKGDNEYVSTILKGVYENRERLDEIISSCLKGWSIDRVSKVSIAVMRLALFEMLYMDDVPMGVSINEAVNIAKKYDGVQAGAFVNGALSTAAKSMVNENGN